ncbi:hypothetical protein CSC94_19090 [Zhengella mangrovi]|uniref:Uncharacterized protein n=1 Tax=Zhengella mangrovi TaxID=1982044 RepID=A0A2G1QIV9_9HYPH|nr:hypothetical protein [Zhengella mangrovi]PHP65463.1 hypothetical protein CSC94_19090 [Zhengella mangrovi]
MHRQESDIPAPVLIGTLGTGYAAVLLGGALLERLGVPAGVIHWIVVIAAFTPFVALGVFSGSMRQRVFTGADGQGGSLFMAGGLSAAAVTGGLFFFVSVLTIRYTGAMFAAVAGLAAGLLLSGLAVPRPGERTAQPATGSARLYQQTGSQTVRRIAGLFLGLLALGVLVAQSSALHLLLDTLAPGLMPLPWLLTSVIILAGAWTGGFNSAGRSLAFSLVVTMLGVITPLFILFYRTSDLTWTDLLAGPVDIASAAPDPAQLPLALATLEWPLSLPGDWAGLGTLFASMMLAGFVFASLYPSLAVVRGRVTSRRGSLIAALLFLVAALAAALNARLSGIVIAGSLPDLAAGQIGTDAAWLFKPGTGLLSGLVDICGMPADTPFVVQAACGSAAHSIDLADIRVNPATAFLIPAAAYGMPVAVWPAMIAGVALAAAGTAAAMLAALGNLFAEGPAAQFAGQKGRPVSGRLATARAAMLAAAFGAPWIAAHGGIAPLGLLIWPGALAVAALAVPLALPGWKTAARRGPVIAGMLTGALAPAAVMACQGAEFVIRAGDPGEDLIHLLAAIPVPLATLAGVAANLLAMALAGMVWKEDKNRTRRIQDHERGQPGGIGA